MCSSPPREATNITQTCFKFPFEIVSFEVCLVVVGHSKDGEHVYQCYQLEYCICFPFCKCSKCVVRHLGRPPTSPSAYISLLLKKHTCEMWLVVVYYSRDEETVCQTF